MELLLPSHREPAGQGWAAKPFQKSGLAPLCGIGWEIKVLFWSYPTAFRISDRSVPISSIPRAAVGREEKQLSEAAFCYSHPDSFAFILLSKQQTLLLTSCVMKIMQGKAFTDLFHKL